MLGVGVRSPAHGSQAIQRGDTHASGNVAVGSAAHSCARDGESEITGNALRRRK